MNTAEENEHLKGRLAVIGALAERSMQGLREAEKILTVVQGEIQELTAKAITLRRMQNVIRILFSIELWEFQEVGLFQAPTRASAINHPEGWKLFVEDPCIFLIRCDDDVAEKIWSVVERRLKTDKPALVVVEAERDD
jgi:hypothetical protein